MRFCFSWEVLSFEAADILFFQRQSFYNEKPRKVLSACQPCQINYPGEEVVKLT